METLIQGYEYFRAEVFPEQQRLFQKLASGQEPQALFLTCADSRVVPDLILQTRPGDLFLCRNAGNIVPPYGEIQGGVSATIEYAVCVLKVPDIIICGHSDCGAMKAALNGSHLEGMPNVAAWLRYSEAAKQLLEHLPYDYQSPHGKLRAMTRANVIQQLAHLRTHASVAARLQGGQLTIHGWVYDIGAGKIEAFDPEFGRFVKLERQQLRKASNSPRLEL
jgi:carbonic anhydrase